MKKKKPLIRYVSKLKCKKDNCLYRFNDYTCNHWAVLEM